MHFSTPEIILLVLCAISLLLAANKHGQTKKADEHNFWWTLTAWAIQLGLLYWAGLFH